MFWCKIFTTKQDIVAAICDENLLDREIKMKKPEIKVKISKEFYGERLIDEHFALEVMRRATIGNLMGKEIINLADKNGFIVKKNIILIDDIPHAQFVKIL